MLDAKQRDGSFHHHRRYRHDPPEVFLQDTPNECAVLAHAIDTYLCVFKREVKPAGGGDRINPAPCGTYSRVTA